MAHDRLPHPLISFVAGLHGVTTAELLSASRRREVSVPRMVLCWMLRQHGYSYPAIGRLVDKDHSSVFHAVGRVQRDAALQQHARACLSLLEEVRLPALLGGRGA